MRVVIWCGMLRWWTPLHQLMSRPRQRWQARRPRLPRREKNVRYSALLNTHVFVPLAMETLGPINVTDQNFMRDLGRKLTTSTGENERPVSCYNASLSPYNVLI